MRVTQLVFIIERTNFLSRAVWSKSDFDLVENTCTYVNQDTRFWSKFDFLTKLEIGPEFQNYNHRPKYWPITLAKKPNGIVHGRTQTTRLAFGKFFVKNKNSGKKTRFFKKKSFFYQRLRPCTMPFGCFAKVLLLTNILVCGYNFEM